MLSHILMMVICMQLLYVLLVLSPHNVMHLSSISNVFYATFLSQHQSASIVLEA